MSTTVISLYAAGMIVAFMCMLAVAPRFDAEPSVPRRGALAVLGATLWPILIVGLLEFVSVVAYRKTMHRGHAHALRRV